MAKSAPTVDASVEPKTVDAAGYVQTKYGIELLGKSESSGVYKARIPDTETGEVIEKELDLHALMRQEIGAQGGSDLGFKFQASSPERPLKEDVGLTFREQLDFANTKTARDKLNYLQKTFGSDNVKFNPDSKQFVVKADDGDWRPAEAGFVASLVGAEKGTIAGGIAGAKLGAAAGLPGVVVGGALGATVGRLAQIKDAELAGLRDEEDYRDLGKELSKEFLVNLAFGAGVPVIGAGLKAGSKVVSGALKRIASFGDSKTIYTISKYLEQTTGTNADDIVRAMKNPEKIAAKHSQLEAWELAGIERGIAAAGPNPVKREATNQLIDLIDKSHKHMMNEFGAFVNRADVRAVTSKAKVSLEKLVPEGSLDDVMTAMKEGLVESADKRTVDLAHNILKGAEKRGGSISFDEAKTIIDKLNQVIDARGGFSAGPNRILPKTTSFLLNLRNNLAHRTAQGVNAVDAKIGKELAENNAKYSSRRAFFDEFGNNFDKKRVDSTFMKFFEERGELLRENVQMLLDGVVKEPSAVVEELALAKTAIETSKWFSKQVTFGSGALGRVAGIATSAITSPRKAPKLAGKLVNFKPLLSLARGAGKLNEWVGKLDQVQRKALLENPALVMQLTRAPLQAMQLEEATFNELRSAIGQEP